MATTMPYVEIITSATVVEETSTVLLERSTSLVAQHLEKPPQLVMARVCGEQAMAMAGTRVACAVVAIQLIGAPAPTAKASLCADLTKLLGDELGVPPERVFVTLTSIARENWGVRGAPLA